LSCAVFISELPSLVSERCFYLLHFESYGCDHRGNSNEGSSAALHHICCYVYVQTVNILGGEKQTSIPFCLQFCCYSAFCYFIFFVSFLCFIYFIFFAEMTRLLFKEYPEKYGPIFRFWTAFVPRIGLCSARHAEVSTILLSNSLYAFSFFYCDFIIIIIIN